MCTCDACDLDALAGEILRYLREHRQAADTPEGIARWWIKRQRLEDSILRVQSALNLLVERSLVRSRANAAGARVYSLSGSDGSGSSSDGER